MAEPEPEISPDFETRPDLELELIKQVVFELLKGDKQAMLENLKAELAKDPQVLAFLTATDMEQAASDLQEYIEQWLMANVIEPLNADESDDQVIEYGQMIGALAAGVV
jgi:hypothetical protein